MAKKMAREAAFFVCALACGAEKWYDNYLRNVREVILYEIRYRGRFHLSNIFINVHISPYFEKSKTFWLT
jgi:hypothetical protein